MGNKCPPRPRQLASAVARKRYTNRQFAIVGVTSLPAPIACILASRTDTQVASPVIQTVVVYVIYVHPVRIAHNHSVQALAANTCVQAITITQNAHMLSSDMFNINGVDQDNIFPTVSACRCVYPCPFPMKLHHAQFSISGSCAIKSPIAGESQAMLVAQA